MSPSKPDRPKGRILASASADTEVFLIDHAFQLVTRTVGSLDVTVDPGLYKIKFRRGQVTREEIVALPPGATETFVPTPLGLDAADAMPPAAEVEAELPAPLLGGALEAASSGAADSAIAVFVAASEVRDTEGLTVVDDAGREVLDVGAAGYRSSSGVSARLALPAGTYRLRLGLGGHGTLEQSVVLLAGWETRLELAAAAFTAPDGASVTRSDPGNASVYMARMDATSGSHDHTQARSFARLVRAWLAGPQVTIATSHAERLLSQGITEPLFAICVAHTLVRQVEFDRSRGTRESKPRRRLIKSMVTALQALVPAHPDVDALSVWLGRNPTVSFAAPPMLVSSWGVLTSASAERSRLLPAGSLSALVAEHIWTSPVWLQWRGDRIEAPAEPVTPLDRPALISQVLAHVASQSRTPPETLDDLERALWNAVKRGGQGESVRKLGVEAVKRLGVPAATFDRALAALVKKLEP